ncbi:MAG: flagellar hook-associated protein FlgK [Micavibrio sp.]|nr:flagellar hook-associated protein FlgK [Micavibrio sp.]
MAGTLATALSGLRVSQQQISVISGNVSNVGTPGYTRKILPQSTQSIEGRTIGVLPDTIIRNVNMNLTRNLWTQVSSVGNWNVKETYLNRVEQFHGPPDKELSVASSVSKLKDTFSALADSPEDTFLRASTISQAQTTAKKVNDFATLLNDLRSDAQSEMQATVSEVNALLEQIAELNNQVKTNLNLDRTTAALEDQRDMAIKELTGLIDISFFTRGDGTLVVQTNEGAELAGDIAQSLYFSPSPVSPSTYYPASASGLYVNNPITQPIQAVDITATGVGGKLGGLIELRDEILPKQIAQLDELAHKMALRFDQQGLRLFTDSTGTIPGDDAPDPTINIVTGLPTATVQYIGFAGQIQVNEAILNDHSLLQKGTFGATNLQSGSNEVIRRVIENTFTATSHQQAENLDTATQVDLLNTGGADLQTWLGLASTNTINGGRDLTPFLSITDLITSANGDLDINPPADTFDIILTEPNTGLGPVTLTVDISDAEAIGVGANAAAQMVDYINNTLIPGAALPAGLTASASVGPNGQLLINTNGSYQIDSTAGIGETGLVYLGLADTDGDTVDATHPYFDIQVGNRNPVRITINPGDTSAELVSKLQNVEGLAIDLDAFAGGGDGILRLRPGNDFNNPDFGGELQVVAGNFKTTSAAYGQPPAVTGTRANLDNNVNVVSALFGTYTVLGTGAIQNDPPVDDFLYASETDASLAAPIPTTPMRTDYLGPGANISTGLVGSTTLVDFAQKIVNDNAQSINVITARKEDDQALHDLLETQLNNESGVNLDEELGHLIVVQTAYSASARVLTVVDELFKELLNAV